MWTPTPQLRSHAVGVSDLWTPDEAVFRAGFAELLARHPEALGIGGVVRPGTGLKEPPSLLPSMYPWKAHQ